MKKNFLQVPSVLDIVKPTKGGKPTNTKFKVREMLYLQQLVYQLPQKAIIVEIGSFIGKSALALAEAAEKIDGSVLCVDPFAKHTQSFCPDQLERFKENTAGWDNIYLAKSDSTKFFDYNPGVKFDMIFIDGDHSINGFITDLRNAIVHSKKIVCGHDFCAYSPWIVDVIQHLSVKFGVNYEVVSWTWKLDISKKLRKFADSELVPYLIAFIKKRGVFYNFENSWYKESGIESDNKDSVSMTDIGVMPLDAADSVDLESELPDLESE